MAQMWIDNRWTGAADGRVFEVRNPATEERARHGAPGLRRRRGPGRRRRPSAAFPEWRRTPGIERGREAAPRRPPDPRGPRGPRHPAHQGGRQAPAREPRRDRVDRGLLRLLRGDRPRRRGPGDQPGGAQPVQLRGEGALRRRRPDRALELPAAAALAGSSRPRWPPATRWSPSPASGRRFRRCGSCAPSRISRTGS